MRTSLLAIAKKARERKDLRFFNLYRLIDEALLLDCWRDIRKNAAFGVDGISAEEYGENLTGNIRDLVDRLKRKTYRARLVAQSPESAPRKGHAGICAGAARATGRPTAMVPEQHYWRGKKGNRLYIEGREIQL